MATFQNVTIQEIKTETANAVSVVFNIPENLKSDFNFTAGQYITLQTKINNQEIRRAYSICSTPQSGEIRVAIKAVENGTFSVYATSNLKVGDAIEISAPEGRFQLKPEANKNYIAFAAGSGITPILSMVKTVLENQPTATFTLVYGNKSIADTIFYEELVALDAKYSNFNLEFVVLKKTAKGLITKTTRIKSTAVFHVYNNIKSSIFIFADNKIKRIEINKTLNDSLKYNNSFKLLNFPLPNTIPITTTANNPDS